MKHAKIVSFAASPVMKVWVLVGSVWLTPLTNWHDWLPPEGSKDCRASTKSFSW